MSQDPMTIDLDAIEQAARAATPGPWRVDAVERIVGPERICDHGTGPEDDPVVIVETDGGYYPPEPPDLAYLLAANPSTVLALVARVRELEAALGEARRQATAADNDRDEAIGRRERVEVGLLEAIDGWSSRDYDSFDADDRERLRVTLNLPR